MAVTPLVKSKQDVKDTTAALQGTTPGTAAQLQAGTDTVVRGWTAKQIHDEIARQIAAAP